MQFAYALTADGPDTFAAMTAVNVHALRRLHPDAAVTVAVDEQTAATGVPSLPWWPEQTCFVTVETGLIDPVGRNRFVKTKLRDVLEGPFLYLDGDALPVRVLNELFEHGADFAAVPNRHRGAVYAQFPPECVPDYVALGWPLPAGPYFNGGVWYCADSAAAKLFGSNYHELWLSFLHKTGSFRDQASLNAAVDAARTTAPFRVVSLPLRYNAFVDLAACFARGAHIWHFYTRGGAPPAGSVLAALVDGLQSDGRIEWSILDEAVARDNAWRAGLRDGADSLEQYLQAGRAAVASGDLEVAGRLVLERLRRKPYSPRTWKLLVRIALAHCVERRR